MTEGRWGLVIVFSSFINYVVVGGIVYSVGIFFSAFQADFHSNKYQTSWVSSVLSGTLMVEGPLVSAFVNLYGCRLVSIAGCLLAAAVFCFSTLSTSITSLILTYGLLGGFALGFVYQPSVVIVGYYFQRRRAMAIGIACCGSGIGVFVCAPLFSFFVEKYDWRTTTFLIAAMILLCCYPCATFKPLPCPRSQTTLDVDLERKFSFDSYDMEIIVKAKKDPKVDTDGDTSQTVSKHGGDGDSGIVCVKPIYRSGSPAEPSESRSDLSSDTAGGEQLESNMSNSVSSCYPRKLEPIPEEQHVVVNYDPQHRKVRTCRVDDSNVNRACVSSSTVSSSSKVGDVAAGKVRYKRERFSFARSVMWIRCLMPLQRSLASIGKPSFMVYCATCFLMSIGLFVPYTFLPKMAEELNIGSTKASYLLSTIGIANVIARLVAGLLVDRYHRVSLLLNNTALVLGGLTTGLVPFVSSYPLLVAYCFVFGLTIGYVWDATGDYHYAFYLIGVIMTFAGVIGFPLTRIASWEKRRDNGCLSWTSL